MDRDNELWFYFLPGALKGEPRPALSAWSKKKGLDKVHAIRFCSSTENPRERRG